MKESLIASRFLVAEDLAAFKRSPKDFSTWERALESINSHIKTFSLWLLAIVNQRNLEVI